MAAQNTKTIQYRLRNGQSVEVTINNDGVPRKGFYLLDLAIEKPSCATLALLKK